MIQTALLLVLLAPVPLISANAHTRSISRVSKLRGDGTLELLRLYPYYHSTDQIWQRLEKLAVECPVLTLETVNGTSQSGNAITLQVVTVRDPGAKPVNRNFLLFGEHAREMISPESGLHFVESLCGGHGLGKRARNVLKTSEFQMVINANPVSRREVEKGDECLRLNPNGVDLNRNWDEKWAGSPAQGLGDITNPGPAPFSEAETRVLRSLVEKYKPTNFVTVHSGTKGLYMPWAYDMVHMAKRNKDGMMKILKKLDKDYCQCPFGAAGKEVGYSCPGTCLDWVYDKLKAPYAFAFEIYTDPDTSASLMSRWEEKMKHPDTSFLQEHGSLAHEHFRDVFDEHPSSFVQLQQQRLHHQKSGGCFGQFNPATEADFKDTVHTWTNVFLDLADLVATDLSS